MECSVGTGSTWVGHGFGCHFWTGGPSGGLVTGSGGSWDEESIGEAIVELAIQAVGCQCTLSAM